MRRVVPLVVAAMAALTVAFAAAEIHASGAQMRASLGRSTTTAGYVVLHNAGPGADRLVGASCACAARVELHMHQMQGGVARMSPVGAIKVPADGSAVLAPGGAHLMFIGLKARVADGTRQRVTLVFERAGPVTVAFTVKARIEAPPAAHQH